MSGQSWSDGFDVGLALNQRWILVFCSATRTPLSNVSCPDPMVYRRIVLGFEGEKNMPKLNFSGNLPNTIRNNILKLPVIPAGAFSNIQDGVQDGRQNVNTTI